MCASACANNSTPFTSFLPNPLFELEYPYGDNYSLYLISFPPLQTLSLDVQVKRWSTSQIPQRRFASYYMDHESQERGSCSANHQQETKWRNIACLASIRYFYPRVSLYPKHVEKKPIEGTSATLTISSAIAAPPQRSQASFHSPPTTRRVTSSSIRPRVGTKQRSLAEPQHIMC